ncbi:MAG: DNA-directed RNA polymerase subunit N [Candidatus Aenigmatarchaeota archaeon]|nr:DNA-directed RNA polymerase subunit N [Candidatus Aenigmarchaeota archaeon]
MIIPVRCMSCGRPIAHLWEAFKKRTATGEEAKKVLDELGVKSYCCRATLLGHVDIMPKVARYKR